MILGQKVKTTVVGGRPIAGPMQSIAGVEGAQVCAFREIRNTARAAIEIAPKAQRHGLRGGEVGILAEGYAAKRGLGAINVKNQFSKGHLETPMQFLEQNANCRFFYTAKMLGSPELVWKRAIDATWTDPKKNCVQGSRQNDPETPLKKDPKIPLKNGSARVSLRSSSHFIITITTVVLLSTGLFLW